MHRIDVKRIVIGLLTTILLVSHALAADDKTQVYLLGGGPVATPLQPQPIEFEQLKEAIESSGLKDFVDAHVYTADGRSVDGSTTFLEDVQGARNADKFFVFYSDSAIQADRLISIAKKDGIPLGTVLTLATIKRDLRVVVGVPVVVPVSGDLNFTDTNTGFVITIHSKEGRLDLGLIIVPEGVNTVGGETQQVGPVRVSVPHPEVSNQLVYGLTGKEVQKLQTDKNKAIEVIKEKSYVLDVLRTHIEKRGGGGGGVGGIGVVSSGGAGVESKPIENIKSESFRILSFRRYYERMKKR